MLLSTRHTPRGGGTCTQHEVTYPNFLSGYEAIEIPEPPAEPEPEPPKEEEKNGEASKEGIF